MSKYPVKFERVASNFKHYEENIELPESIDLRSICPPINNEKNIDIGIVDSLISVYQFNSTNFSGSRLFLNYNIMHENNSDILLSNSINVFRKYGVCKEELWTNDDSENKTENTKIKPSNECYTDALSHRMMIINNIDHNLKSIKTCLASGNPFVLGVMVYSSFETDTFNILKKQFH